MPLLRSIHAWAGFVLALVVTAIAASGVLLVFKTDYLRLTLPAARGIAPTDATSLGRAATSADELFTGNVRSIVFASDGLGLHKVYLKDGGGAYLDPRGKVVDQWSQRGRPEEWLFDLHQKLLLGEPGHIVAGVVGLAASVMVITGLALWWPARRAFRGRVWPESGRRRHLLSQHRDLGVLAALPILLLTLTGATLVFPEATRSVLDRMLPSGVRAEARSEPPSRPAAARGGSPDWAQILATAQAEYPDSRLRVLAWPGQAQVVQVRLRQPAEWHPNGRTRVSIDRDQGAVIESSDALAAPAPARVYNLFYPLHAGGVGGRAYDLLVVLAGVSLCALALIGGTSFLAHRRRARSVGDRDGSLVRGS